MTHTLDWARHRCPVTLALTGPVSQLEPTVLLLVPGAMLHTMQTLTSLPTAFPLPTSTSYRSPCLNMPRSLGLSFLDLNSPPHFMMTWSSSLSIQHSTSLTLSLLSSSVTTTRRLSFSVAYPFLTITVSQAVKNNILASAVVMNSRMKHFCFLPRSLHSEKHC